jgi:hypothetical protein
VPSPFTKSKKTAGAVRILKEEGVPDEQVTLVMHHGAADIPETQLIEFGGQVIVVFLTTSNRKIPMDLQNYLHWLRAKKPLTRELVESINSVQETCEVSKSLSSQANPNQFLERACSVCLAMVSVGIGMGA